MRNRSVRRIYTSLITVLNSGRLTSITTALARTPSRINRSNPYTDHVSQVAYPTTIAAQITSAHHDAGADQSAANGMIEARNQPTVGMCGVLRPITKNTANCARYPITQTPITAPLIEELIEILNKLVVSTAGAMTSTHHSADNMVTARHLIRVT